MALEKAKAYLEKRGYGDRVMVFDVSSATVELAAKAVGTEPGSPFQCRREGRIDKAAEKSGGEIKNCCQGIRLR